MDASWARLEVSENVFLQKPRTQFSMLTKEEFDRTSDIVHGSYY